MNKSKVTSEMAQDSGADLFSSARNVGRKGLQQYFTPPPFADWLADTVKGLCRYQDPSVLDPTAGAGNLLAPFARDGCDVYGIELDRTVLVKDFGILQGNLQRIAPYLRELRQTWDVLALNPPFGLEWENSDGKLVNSCSETFKIGESLAADTSLGFMICDERNWKHFAAGEFGKWKLGPYFKLTGLFTPESECVCIVSFWGTHVFKLSQDLGELSYSRFKTWNEDISEGIRECFEWMRSWHCTADPEQFRVAVAAASARAPESPFNLYLKNNLIKLRLSDFDALKIKNQTGDDKLITAIRKLNGRSPRYFALNTIEADQLSEWIDAGLVTLEPRLSNEINKAVMSAARLTAPYYTLKPTQRLGYLDRLDEIKCIKEDPDRWFAAGKSYPLSVSVVVQTEDAHRATQRRSQITGEFEPAVRETQRTSKHLNVTIDPLHEGQAAHTFDESTESITYIVEHFDVPDPGNIADLNPESYATWKNRLKKLETSHLTFRDFQLDDMARFQIRGSGVCGWEQGLGKMLFGLAVAKSRGVKRALVIAPQDLIPQWTAEAASKLGIRLQRIKSIAHAREIAKTPKPAASEPAEYFIVHYEALSRNGTVCEVTSKLGNRLWESYYKAPKDGPDLSNHYESKRAELQAAYLKTNERGVSTPDALKCCPRCTSSMAWTGTYCDPRVTWTLNKVESRGCGYVHYSRRVHPMSHWIKKAFSLVICDEGTKIQGDNSMMSLAVRSLRPRLRIVLTGTPVKNYLPSAFWLLWWVNGGRATATFPYNHLEKDKFTADYCVQERDKPNEKTDGKWGAVRTLPNLCNVNMLWKLLAPNMLRRRKSETGETLVEKKLIPVFVPFGSHQSRAYSWWVANFGSWYCARPDKDVENVAYAEAFAAIFGQQMKLRFAATVPASPGLRQYDGRASHSNSTPKLLMCLQLIRQALESKEPVIVFSSLREASQLIKLHLDRAGIKSRIADGQTKPADRSILMQEFKAGKYQVLIAGIEAVNLGHNLENARRAIVFSLPWDLAGFEQAINRIHRLTSKRDCIVHILCTQGSIDEKMWDLIESKGKYAGLAIDGALGYEDVNEIDWNEFLRDLRESYEEASNTVPEEIIEDRVADVFSGLHIIQDSHGRQLGAAVGSLDMAISQTNFTYSPF